MIRSVATALVGTTVLAALAGCAYQESFALPELTPQGTSPGVQVYPGIGYGNGYGYGIAGSYGYPNGYPPGYGFADPYYAGQGPYPYDPYYHPYGPYPRYVVVPCPDNNGDGRCDRKPSKDHEHQGNDGHGRGHDRDDPPVPPRYVRDVDPETRSNAGRRARRDAAPVVQPPSAPATAPVLQPRATVTPTTSPEPKQPVRARPDPRRDRSPTQEP